MGLAELVKDFHYKVSVRLEMGSDAARHIQQRRRPGGHKHIHISMIGQYNNGHEQKRLSVSSSGHEEQNRRSLHETP